MVLEKACLLSHFTSKTVNIDLFLGTKRPVIMMGIVENPLVLTKQKEISGIIQTGNQQSRVQKNPVYLYLCGDLMMTGMLVLNDGDVFRGSVILSRIQSVAQR